MDEQSLTRQYRGLVKFYVAGISASVRVGAIATT
jgi:hypothetical protein